MAATIPVLLDTDIGSDIDDALCLAYLLKQPRCELLGVTTVSGNTMQRAALADVICKAAGKNVAIHTGAPGPLLFGPGQPEVPQYAALASRPHRTDFAPGSAIEFLRQQIRSRPREITLLGIGPLTNIALLFAGDPEIPGLLKELILMCGVFTSGAGHGPGAREWNALVDPVATAMVYAARPPVFRSVGLDVTMKCQLGADECRKRFKKAGGPLAIVAEMAEIWFKGRPEITFHDPLAGALIFEPDLCGYSDGEVQIETASHALGGLTSFNAQSKSHPHRIAVSVQPPEFFKHYFGVVGG
ncbi:MAG TPA: nucleoside hydrolase [Planctomycetota bacterium]|jgi:purine nucleosidase